MIDTSWLDAEDALAAHEGVTRELTQLRVTLATVKYQLHQTRTSNWITAHQEGERTDSAKAKWADHASLDWSRQMHDLQAEVDALEDIREHLELRITKG